MNNRNLFIALAILLVVFFVGKFFKTNKSGSFDPVLISVDTMKVNRITFSSANDTFELNKTSTGWEARRAGLSIQVPLTSMQGILSPLVMLKADRVVTNDPARYPEYEIEDGTASKVTVFQGKKEVGSLILGGFRFDQVARTASTFVRKSEEPEVYMCDGLTTMGLKVRFDHFRDKKLVNVQAEDLSTIEWIESAGRKEIIQKEDGVWHYAGMEAVDSIAFHTYLTALVNTQGIDFSNMTSAENLALVEKITLFGNNMTAPVILSAYASADAAKPFLIHSSSNPQAYFTSDSAGIYKSFFTDLRFFFPNG